MAYYEQPPGDERPGCMDAVVVTRAVLGLLFWPFLVLALGMLDLFSVFWAFSVHPALALVPLAATAAAIAAFAVWESRKSRPPFL